MVLGLKSFYKKTDVPLALKPYLGVWFESTHIHIKYFSTELGTDGWLSLQRQLGRPGCS